MNRILIALIVFTAHSAHAAPKGCSDFAKDKVCIDKLTSWARGSRALRLIIRGIELQYHSKCELNPEATQAALDAKLPMYTASVDFACTAGADGSISPFTVEIKGEPNLTRGGRGASLSLQNINIIAAE